MSKDRGRNFFKVLNTASRTQALGGFADKNAEKDADGDPQHADGDPSYTDRDSVTNGR